MTATASGVAPPAPGAPPGGSGVRRPHHFAWGAMLIAVTVLIAAAIIASFGGTFTSFSTVTAQLPASSTAVGLNAPVEYRDVTVGKVASEGKSVPGGLVSVTIHLQPGALARIPAGVRATVTPVSFFGNEYIVLEPPLYSGGSTLRAGQVIPAVPTGETASLQATVGDLDHLVEALHPTQLDAALTAIAQAIQGQGTSLGTNLVEGNNYLEGMLPLWPTVLSDFSKLVPVANTFTAATPNILAILAYQTLTGQTVANDATNVKTALSLGATSVSQSAQLFSDIQQPFELLANDSGPFLQAIGQNPNEISELLSSLSTWATSWLAAEASGPYLTLTANVSVLNPADLGVAVLGGSDVTQALQLGLGSSYVNPPTYTAANCPVFGNLSGCGGVTKGSGPITTAATTGPAGAGAVMPEPAQTQTIAQIMTATSGHRPAAPAVDALLLSPVLESVASS